MINIRNLQGIPKDKLYQAFDEAFADYEIPIDRAMLSKMMVRRGFDPEKSFGAFDGDRLVAFTFNSIGSFQGYKTVYDTGTGTIKEYRGKGLATKIFEAAIPVLLEAGAEQYLLEVLSNNGNAIALYKKMGFSISRELLIFREKKENIPGDLYIPSGYTLAWGNIPDQELVKPFEDTISSWQNSFESMKRGAAELKSLSVYYENTLVGYGICEPVSGDISRFAVSPDHRRKGIGSWILRSLMAETDTEFIKVLTVPDDAQSLKLFLKALGIESSGKLFEMTRPL